MGKKGGVLKILLLSILFIIVGYYIWYLAMNNIMPKINKTVIPEAVTSDITKLDEYLDSEEKLVEGIRWNVRKQIRWHNGEKKKTKYSIIYIHGYTATKTEISPVPEKFADSIGANVYFVRLAGSGQGEGTPTEQDMKYTNHVKAKQWEEAYDEAYQIGHLIGEKLIVMGTSTGATIALDMTYLRGYDDIFTFIFVSPNLGPKQSSSFITNLPLGMILVKHIVGEYMKEDEWIPNDTPENKDSDLNINSTDYLYPMMDLVWKVTHKIDFSKATKPLLVFYSEKDNVVNHHITEKIVAKYGGKKVTHVINDSPDEQWNHLITGDRDHKGDKRSTTDRVVVQMSQYINELEAEAK